MTSTSANVQVPNDNIKTAVKEVHEEEAAEERDKIRRSKNIIIHGVEDPATEDATKKDEAWVKTLIEKLHVKINIKYISRIGKSVDGKKRPLIVTLNNQLTKIKKKELNEVISKEQPDIIAICEVKPKHSKKERLIQDYHIEGYSEPYETNALNDVGRGIIVLTHKSIKNVVEVTPNSEFQEVCLLEIKLKGADSLLFGCMYRSPTNTPTSAKNNTALNLLLKEIAMNKKYSHKCIVGDFNYKDINWENWSTPHDDTKEDEQFLEALRDSFFYQHVDEPTRARGTDTPSLIDLILTNEESQVSNITYLSPLHKSDHSVLSFTFECYLETECIIENYNYNKADFEAMKGHFENSDWVTGFHQKAGNANVNDCWKMLRDKLFELRNRYVPRTKGKHAYGKKGSFAIDQDIQQSLKEKRRLHRKWIRSIGTTSEQRNRAIYATARNKVTGKIRRERRRLEERICGQAKRSPKKFWKHIRNSMKTKTGISPLLLDPNDKSSLRFTDEDKADILQDQFCSVFTNEPAGSLPEFPSRTDTDEMLF
ncbi:uncharacterized protein [Clytia hemisphaerica]|uniref:uncharacterized protein n=1 Tax=Clytia hemisphaerica TaxID=252671 RepID=UPI0034D78BCF